LFGYAAFIIKMLGVFAIPESTISYA